MLLLTRKIGEVIYIIDNETGHEVTLIVSDIQPNNVKIGLEDNDRRYTFLRKEVRMREEGSDNVNPYYKDTPTKRSKKSNRTGRFGMPPKEES
jgi:sRNA-binding carbon storage regulator CsrA